MKNFSMYPQLKWLAFIGIALAISCKNNNAQLSAPENAMVTDSVTSMAANISFDISTHGPAAWLNYFENTPGFSMASDGALVFKDYATAKTYTLDTVVKNFKKISLNLKNVKVDPLTTTYASFGADFHEDIVLMNGQNLLIGGYLTATAHFDGSKWKLRNLNWAVKAQQNQTN